MKILSVRSALITFAAVALVGGGMMLGRLTLEREEGTSKAPRYKTTVRILDENAGVGDSLDRIKSVQSPERLQAVVDALALTRRWKADTAAAIQRLSGMIEARVEPASPEVLIVTIRSADKKEPEDIAAALARAMVRTVSADSNSSKAAPESALEASKKRQEAVKHQLDVLEDARVKLTAALLKSGAQKPSPLEPELKKRAAITQRILRIVRDKGNGRDPAIPLSEDERADVRAAIEEFKEKAGGDLSAEHATTLDLMGSSGAETPEMTVSRQALADWLEARLGKEKETISGANVRPEDRAAYQQAKAEYEAALHQLNHLREFSGATPQNGPR